MSDTHDTNQSRGRPVLKRIELLDLNLERTKGFPSVWGFCGEYEGTEQKAVDAASDDGWGDGVYKTFASGSWPGGYLRD